MKHVRDGELHAYLDGALDALPGERGEEIRAHLSACAVCRERLEEEERVRADAREIMEGATAAPMEVPPFEEVRRRGAGGPPPETPGDEAVPSGEGNGGGPWTARSLPLAWAATVIVALGVGWMGGEVWRSLPREGGLPATGVPASSDESVPGLRDRPRTPATPETSPASSDTALSRTATPETSPVSADTALFGPRDTQARSEAPTASVEVEAPSRRKEEAAGSEVAPVVLSAPSSPKTSPVQLGSVAAEEPMARTRASALDRPALDVVPHQPRVPVTEGERSMTVPGLEVLSVEWEEWIPGERGLHVRQRLSMGDTLELRFLGLLMGAEPPPPSEAGEGVEPERGASPRPLSPKVLEASLPPGWNQVVMRWGRGWVVARAPVPAASIRALLRSMM